MDTICNIMNEPSIANVISYKERVRSLVTLLKGKDQDLRADLRAALLEVDPFQLEMMEEEMLGEGIGREDMILLYDEWSKMVMQDARTDLERDDIPSPLRSMMREHDWMLSLMQDVRDLARNLREGTSPIEAVMDHGSVRALPSLLKEHMLKEEALSPFLEAQGVMELPALIWAEHEVLRAKGREMLSLIGRQRYTERKEFTLAFDYQTSMLLSLFCAHFRREERDFFPTVRRVLDPRTWDSVRESLEKVSIEVRRDDEGS